MPRRFQANKTTRETPEERHEEFLRENGEWNRKVDEALREVEEAAADLEREARNGAASPDRECHPETATRLGSIGRGASYGKPG